jgi:hypothetical protein
MSFARRLAVLWLLASGAVIAGLAVEVAFRAQRSWAKRAAAQYREANVFEKGREVLEGSGDSLWLQPGARYRPGARLDVEVAGTRFEIVINSRGFRTHEFTVEKPAGLFRVVCIGGSTTVQGRTNEETYPALLERALRARYPGRPLEVLNLGVNGTGSDFWVERQDGLFRLAPDLVLQYDFVNDLFFRHLPRYADEHPRWTAARHSLFVAWSAPPAPADLEPYLTRTLRNVRQMAGLSGAHEAGHVAGAFAAPDPERAAPAFRRYLDLNTEAWGGRAGLRFYRDYHAVLVDYDRRLRKASGEGRLVVADVDERVSDPSLFIDLCHMTGAGIEALASAMLPEVERAMETHARAARDTVYR